jgi:hypothetical protein
MAEDNLRDTIAAALRGDATPEGGEAAAEGLPSPAIVAADKEAPAGSGEAPAGDAETAAPAGEAKARDASGKFASAEKTVDNQQTEAAQAAQATLPDEEASRPPHALPAALKAKWGELAPEWRKAISDQEQHVNKFRAEQQSKAERLNRFDAVISPRKAKLTLNGVQDHEWVERLAAAEDLLESNPVEGLLYLARTYNADPRQLVARITGGQPGGQSALPAMDPALAPILSELQTLKTTMAQQQAGSQAERDAVVQAHIHAFANDPANLYFEDVKPQVAALLTSGQANDLKTAYDMAVWANPEIRGLMLQAERAKAAQADQTAQARAKATAAASAAVSVTGAPGPGASPGGGVDPSNLRGLLAAAIDEQAGRV